MPYRPVTDSTRKQIRKAGNLIWTIDIYVQGLRRYQKRHYGTRTEIARLESKIYQEMLTNTGRAVDGHLQDPTFSEFAAWYIQYKKPLQKRWDTTLGRIRNIERFLYDEGLEKKKISQFKTSDVIDFMSWRREHVISVKTKRRPSEVTIKRDLVCWKTMIKFAVESPEYKINYNFLDPIKLINEEPKFEQGLTIEQYHQLHQAAVDYLKPILEFGANTGWRKSEILALTFRRVKISDLNGYATLEDSKNNDYRMTTLTPDLIETIKSLPSWGICEKCHQDAHHADDECELVFTRRGRKINGFRKALRNAYREADLIHIYDAAKPFHRLRNFFRTNHADMGTDMAVVMQEGGWKSPQMMIRYLNRRQEMRTRIAQSYSDYLKKPVKLLDLKKEKRNIAL